MNWGLYYFDDEEATPNRLQGFCESYSNKVWIDIAADLATLALFSAATVVVLMIGSRDAVTGG